MKILFIGGTGTISRAISQQVLEQGHQLYLLNRGNRNDGLRGEGVHHIACDIHDELAAQAALKGPSFDVVADFISFTPEDAERDVRLFIDKTAQFIHVSTAAAYQKPPLNPIITEETPLGNPHWAYARKKIATEERLWESYQTQAFPVTIVRPSHTYDERKIPLGVYGDHGTWQVAKRMLDGKPVIIHGDGTSLWTMTHTRDHASGFIGLMGNPGAIGEAVHITSDESLCWNQIYGAIAHGLGVELNAVHIPSWTLHRAGPYDFEGGLIGDKANSVIFDNSKLKRLVPDFKATTLFAEGVKETIDHVLAHKELQIEDPKFDQWCDKLITRYKGLS
jgi:nucleoside-diphosphate-sugar epimerase